MRRQKLEPIPSKWAKKCLDSKAVKDFLHLHDDGYDVLTEEDLQDIATAERELAEGKTGSWANIK